MGTQHPHTVIELPAPLNQRRADALTECNRLITHFQRKADQHKRAFQFFKYSSIVLTISATMVSALAVLEHITAWAVPVITGLAALSTSLLTVTHAQELWVHSRNMQQQFHAEKFLFEQRAGAYAPLDDDANVQHFAERIMEIWNRGHEQWQQRASDTSTKA